VKLSEEPNPNAEFPSGMCGERKVCEQCPSTFLCWLKASAENKIIKERRNES
jgi:hypothetical protein